MKIREVHAMQDTQMRGLLKEMREAIIALHGTIEPMAAPTNLQVVPIAGGNKVQWTRSNGDGYEIVISKTPSIDDGTTVRVGDSVEYTDNIGIGGETRYYWVLAYSTKGKANSTQVGPESGTTLALGTPAAASNTPPNYDPYRNYPNYQDYYYGG